MKIWIRRATRQDVPTIVALLADDALGSQREKPTEPLPDAYAQAYEAIAGDANQRLVVAVSGGEGENEVVGTLQLTFLPYLTYGGGWRAQIEAVRAASSVRGEGIGGELVRWAIEQARDKGCHLVQLTTDKRRPDALRFYEQLGFRSSHEGMKLHLEDRLVP